MRKTVIKSDSSGNQPSLPLGAFSIDSPLVDSFLNSLPSANTRRAYGKALEALLTFAKGKPLTPAVVYSWRQQMVRKKLSSSTINVRLSAVRKFVETARTKNALPAEDASEMLRTKGVARRGSRMGNWLTLEESRKLLAVPDRKTFRGQRNYMIIALLMACALRRTELANLQVSTIQLREGRWVLADLEGKGGRVRTVAVPKWVKTAIDMWMKEACIKQGTLVRKLTLEDEALSEDAIWLIVSKAAKKIGLKSVGPHDLRRTCAKLCRKRGGSLEQIQMMLGHESIQTTERYLGTEQDLTDAVNDDLGL